MDQKFSVIILAAGQGTRMKSSRPKVLHEVLGVSIIDWVISRVRQAGAEDVIVVIGHASETLREHFSDSDVRLAQQDQQLGTADALLAGLQQQPPKFSDLMVLNGDLPDLNPQDLAALIDAHRGSEAVFTVGSSVVDKPHGMGRIVRSENGSLSSIVEQRDANPTIQQIQEVNLGAYSLDVATVQPHLEKMVKRDLGSDSTVTESYLPHLVEVLNESGIPVATHKSQSNQHFLQVNDRIGMAEVSRKMQDKIQRRLQEDGVTIVDPITTWIESDVEIGPDTVIHPQTVIRRGVRIGSDCEIGPFAHLRSGTVIGNDVKVGDFVEINRSHLQDGVRAKHLAYLGDTTVEERANIGAGAVVANYDGKVKSPTRIGADAFVGSGAVIVAPGKIGNGAIVGAGAVVPPGRDVEPGSTVVGVPARKIQRGDDSISEICEDERGIR